MLDRLFAWLFSLSNSQLFALIIGVIVFFVVLSVVKKVFKFIMLGIAVVALLLYFGLVTPEQLKSSAELLSDKVKQEEIVNLSIISNKVRVSNGVIEFCINDVWYCVDDIERLRVNSDGVYMLEVKDSEVKVADKDVQRLLDCLSED